KALIPQLAAKRILAFEPFIAETSAHIWDASVQDGRIEWMSAMANRLPMMIVGRIIGVPDEDIDKLVRWGYATTQMVEGLVNQDQLSAVAAAVIGPGGYISDTFQHAAADRPDNLLGDLAIVCASGELSKVAAQFHTITLFSF